MLIKGLIITVMMVILFSLGSALFFLVRDRGQSKRTVKALTWRISLSITLFLLLFILFALGIIKPHGIS